MASKKSKKGKRYTDDEKQKIVDFVNSYNEANGRGGAANASKKFGVSQLTVGAWLKKGKTTNKKAAKGAKRGRPVGPKAKVAVAATGGRTKILAALAKADAVIAAKRKELDALEAQFEKLKASL
jgi:transposase-like protein